MVLHLAYALSRHLILQEISFKYFRASQDPNAFAVAFPLVYVTVASTIKLSILLPRSWQYRALQYRLLSVALLSVVVLISWLAAVGNSCLQLPAEFKQIAKNTAEKPRICASKMKEV